MFKSIRVTARSTHPSHEGRHRFAHWRIDNQVYFITARCRDRFAAFAGEEAKAVFWDRFTHWTGHYGFVPWVTSLLDNHYHTLGYLKQGDHLGPMMQHIHGSVAKLVNDTLPQRRREFFRDAKGHEYFDGCIRNQKQCRLAYRYTLTQAVRHGLVTDHRLYPHTRVGVELERGVARAKQLRAFLEGMAYKRFGQPPAR